MTPWTITVDCRDAAAQAAFWALALGYVVEPHLKGSSPGRSGPGVPASPPGESEGVATVVDPAGALPEICFLKVPEGKVAKNRFHLDLQVSGGRHHPWDQRETAIRAHVATLVAAGATVVRELWDTPGLDHIVLQDPEGNEFCVVYAPPVPVLSAATAGPDLPLVPR